MEFETVKFLWKDAASGGGGCPSLSEVPGGYLVNGIPVGEATRTKIPHTAEGEATVFVPANVLDRLRERG